MKIKVNVSILKRRPGDVVSESDSDFKDFQFWAERKDRHQGMEICSVLKKKPGPNTKKNDK